MKDRISAIVDPEVARYLWMGTFHSIFAKILRKEGIKARVQVNIYHL